MYLDKSLKDHTFLQAICRTNRLFPNKTFGRIVDYFGVFDDTARALAFDEESVRDVITNLQELRDQLPRWMGTCLGHFKIAPVIFVAYMFYHSDTYNPVKLFVKFTVVYQPEFNRQTCT